MKIKHVPERLFDVTIFPIMMTVTFTYIFGGALARVIILTVGFVMGFRPDGGVPGVMVAFVLLLVFSFSLSWIWTLISLWVRSEQAAMGVSMFILMPLTFASNIFVDPRPCRAGCRGWWRSIRSPSSWAPSGS